MIPHIFALGGVATLTFYWWKLYNQFFFDSVVVFDTKIMLFSLMGGILPALLWLWFWLKEDTKKPEPNNLILLAFLAGMIMVPFAAHIEHFIFIIFSYIETKLAFIGYTISPLVSEYTLTSLWAFTEEILKYLAIYIVALKSKFFDEPIDALIYLITGAIGFAALENSFFLMSSMTDSGVLTGIMNLPLRFLGATLLHIISSSAIGLAIAFSFYKKKKRKWCILLGIISATVLHTMFNLIIIKTQTIFEMLSIFAYYWLIILILIFLFERVKSMKPLLDIRRKK
ncbi:PrsW family intramembrane metalloprotease [Patescibacteria group bacterium]|nr:PrsW family intramembrane metalloprotease [Patescibacteria group bacterium]MBU1246742.1 PrsW family intramembrane metalloprotease [Patescibacteria group bacterium]MBU1519639.1 PrsW family intramembrane metalloprotease [Patescibacteria group bacterium]MBU1730337.1 PrsW family intramembrane metalloprotease [Patescibacteria group bacterium]MBU1956201.1 PrsW family intramembrane metalloprotease [Patescibacteria group bacterium]